MVFAARDLSKPNTDALAMEKHGNEMKVTKRGRKIDEGCRGGEGRRKGVATSSALKPFSLFKAKGALSRLVTNQSRSETHGSSE